MITLDVRKIGAKNDFKVFGLRSWKDEVTAEMEKTVLENNLTCISHISAYLQAEALTVFALDDLIMTAYVMNSLRRQDPLYPLWSKGKICLLPGIIMIIPGPQLSWSK